MQPFRSFESVVLPMAAPNIDTDQIIPARFLWRKRGDGWAHLLFHDLRFNEDGSERAAFAINQPVFRGAGILVAGPNFGCGSSREHAVWSLLDYGIRCVIAPSFGDIFTNNSFQNGLLPVALEGGIVEALQAALAASPGARMTVDLDAQCVTAPGGAAHAFAIDPFRKECLLAGADDVGYTLRLGDAITDFEAAYERKVSWL